MIKFVLNHIPRGVLQRMAGWAMPVAGLFYAIGRGSRRSGRGVQCPLCGARYRRFMPYGYVSVRKNALCPRCLALERHRLLWLWLERETDLLKPVSRDLPSKAGSCKACDGNGRGIYSSVNDKHGDERNAATARFSRQILHIAPEVCLMRKFDTIYRGGEGTEHAKRYVTADLESPLAKVKMDVQNIPFPDDTFDVVFCNHVLEHVADDRLAMREIYRVIKPGGWGVMLSPVDPTRTATFEDDSITDPAERTRIFGQYDHRRIYGRDYADRLREAGWQVDEIDYFAALPPQQRQLYALRPETLYIVRK